MTLKNVYNTVKNLGALKNAQIPANKIKATQPELNYMLQNDFLKKTGKSVYTLGPRCLAFLFIKF